MINLEQYYLIKSELDKAGARLVAVSKTKSVEDILTLYKAGQRNFGENYVQELLTKKELLPDDIEWHFIGHLQTNKVKMISPFIACIEGVDSHKLLKEINKEAAKQNQVITCLLQVFIASEETKFGLNELELQQLLKDFHATDYPHIRLGGLMGMASFTSNQLVIANEFALLRSLFEKVKTEYLKNDPDFKHLSMGMSSDYKLALSHGSTSVRIGSLLFGERNYNLSK